MKLLLIVVLFLSAISSQASPLPRQCKEWLSDFRSLIYDDSKPNGGYLHRTMGEIKQKIKQAAPGAQAILIGMVEILEQTNQIAVRVGEIQIEVGSGEPTSHQQLELDTLKNNLVLYNRLIRSKMDESQNVLSLVEDQKNEFDLVEIIQEVVPLPIEAIEQYLYFSSVDPSYKNHSTTETKNPLADYYLYKNHLRRGLTFKKYLGNEVKTVTLQYTLDDNKLSKAQVNLKFLDIPGQFKGSRDLVFIQAISPHMPIYGLPPVSILTDDGNFDSLKIKKIVPEYLYASESLFEGTLAQLWFEVGPDDKASGPNFAKWISVGAFLNLYQLSYSSEAHCTGPSNSFEGLLERMKNESVFMNELNQIKNPPPVEPN